MSKNMLAASRIPCTFLHVNTPLTSLARAALHSRHHILVNEGVEVGDSVQSAFNLLLMEGYVRYGR